MKNRLPSFLHPSNSWYGSSHPTPQDSRDEAKLIGLYTGHVASTDGNYLTIRDVRPAGKPPCTVRIAIDGTNIETKDAHGSSDFHSFKEWARHIDGWRNSDRSSSIQKDLP